MQSGADALIKSGYGERPIGLMGVVQISGRVLEFQHKSLHQIELKLSHLALMWTMSTTKNG